MTTLPLALALELAVDPPADGDQLEDLAAVLALSPGTASYQTLRSGRLGGS
jgi:hypothetical protein